MTNCHDKGLLEGEGFPNGNAGGNEAKERPVSAQAIRDMMAVTRHNPGMEKSADGRPSRLPDRRPDFIQFW